MSSAEFRVKKSNNFTLVSNDILRNKDISLKAIGLLCKMLSLPPEWDFSFNGLVSICQESRTSIRTALYELKDTGYVKINESRNNKGQFVYDYEVFDSPYLPEVREISPYTDFPYTDNPQTVEPNTENHTQLNTKELIDKKDKTINGEKYSIFTKHLIDIKYISGSEFNLKYYDNLYDNLKQKGYSDENIYIITNYVVKNIKSNKFLDEYGEEITNKFGYLKSAIESNFKRFEKIGGSSIDDYDWLNDDSLFQNNGNGNRER